jgi:SHS2 domain-containing protein
LMRPAYRFLPDIALADVAFTARGDSPDMLFEACAMALTDVMVDRRSVRPTVEKKVRIKAEDIDGLLYDFLTELIVIKDVDSLLFKRFESRVSRDLRSLVCTMRGEPIDRERNRLRNDVKAVTMHLFGVRNEGGLWKTTVVLDI